ncbi:MAG: diaminopimelate decarboxylase [Myxococcales bacterium]|nr:diaminopimelate decarboxylase [Myxococcales bacterium]
MLERGLLQGERAVVVHDLERMRARVRELTRRFPPGTLHAIAVKANPLVAVLRAAVEVGAGLECASLEEVHLALAAGCPPDKIVFDSPAKTLEELEFGLARGLHLNLDNFDELARVDALRGRLPAAPGVVGLRINPGVSAGAIAITSVGSRGSRFGVALASERGAILDAFRRRPWLTGLHVHVGSQGCSIEQLTDAAARTHALADAIDAELGRDQVRALDLGGGLPTAYLASDAPPSLADYTRALAERVPALMSGARRLVTEFGRAVQAGCGLAISRVEYVKPADGGELAVLHLGADFLMRAVYHPQDWRHEFIALDASGRRKHGPSRPVTLLGPLCFGGDVIARAVELPALTPGDLIAIRDVGAYTLSLWSRHCNRGLPRVLGLERDGAFTVLRERERPEDVVSFWSEP